MLAKLSLKSMSAKNDPQSLKNTSKILPAKIIISYCPCLCYGIPVLRQPDLALQKVIISIYKVGLQHVYSYVRGLENNRLVLTSRISRKLAISNQIDKRASIRHLIDFFYQSNALV